MWNPNKGDCFSTVESLLFSFINIFLYWWFNFVVGYESNHEKKISGYSPDLTPGNTEIASVCYEYSYSDSNSNHSKVG